MATNKNESEINIDQTDGKHLYNNRKDVTYEKLTSSSDVINVYDTIRGGNEGNKERIRNKGKHFADVMDTESDKLECSTGTETGIVTLAKNLALKSSVDITYDSLVPEKDTSNEYDKIKTENGDKALERHISLENTNVYDNMILNATSLNETESKHKPAKSFKESQKALPSEHESLSLQSHQDEYERTNEVDRKTIGTAFMSGKARPICICLVIGVIVLTTVIITMVFTVFKNEEIDVAKCVSFIVPANAFIEHQYTTASLVVGTKIIIHCREGYLVDGTDTVVCSLNGTWSESPACKKRDCGIPSDIMNGYIDELENTTVNSTFTVKCNEGYITFGVETVFCGMDGTWSAQLNCNPVSCGIPQVLDNETVIDYNVTTFGATIEVGCIKGFSLTSASLITCLSNGSWTQIPSCFKTIGVACEEAVVLNDLVRRSRIYKANGVLGSDPFVDDEYLSPNWYSVIFNGEQYLMPDVTTMPQNNFCGTENPIYLKDPLPEAKTFAVNATVCIKTSLSDCQEMYTIAVRKCRNNTIQYYLSRTRRKSAYCFDPPDIKNITEFVSSPNVKLGSLIVTPELRFSEVSNRGVVYHVPFLAFVCAETGGMDRSSLDLLYITYWYIDDEVSFSFESEKGLTDLTENDLIQKGFGLGIMVRCAVKMTHSPVGLKSEIVTSKNVFAGIEVSGNPVYSNRGESVEISLRPTIPYGCYTLLDEQPAAHCDSRVSLYDKDWQCIWDDSEWASIPTAVINSQKQCGFSLEGCFRHELPCTKTMRNITMTIRTPFVSNDDPKIYKLRLTTSIGGTHSIWKGYTIKELTVIIKDNANNKNTCYVHNSINMKTADGRYYEKSDYTGESILYWNKEYNIMVQMKSTECDNVRVYCTCAVSVQAGGDIFLINLCNGMKFIGMTSCRDNALNIQKDSETEYKVLSSIGTVIRVNITPLPDYSNTMDIDIRMAPKDGRSVSGLCGTFDLNKNNDYHTRNGTVTNKATFIDAWRLGNSDIKYLYPTCNHDVVTFGKIEESHICICTCFSEDKPCYSLESEATCSPSQYLNCTLNRMTDNLCLEFSNKCLSIN